MRERVLKRGRDRGSGAVAAVAGRWRRFWRDPLFVVLAVWALLFLLAAVVGAMAQAVPAGTAKPLPAGPAAGRVQP